VNVVTDATSEPTETPTAATCLESWFLAGINCSWPIPCISYVQASRNRPFKPLAMHGQRVNPVKHDNRKHTVKTAAMRRKYKRGRL